MTVIETMALCQGAYILRLLDKDAPKELHSTNLEVCQRINFLDYTLLEIKEEIKARFCHQWSECDFIEWKNCNNNYNHHNKKNNNDRRCNS